MYKVVHSIAAAARVTHRSATETPYRAMILKMALIAAAATLYAFMKKIARFLLSFGFFDFTISSWSPSLSPANL
jgi:hypothetical protein